MSFLPDWFTGLDRENAQRAELADAKLRAIVQKQRDDGYYSDAQWQQIQADQKSESFPDAGYVSSDAFTGRADDSIVQGFQAGWEEGRQNVSNAIGGTVNKLVADPLRAILGGIPWWVWLLGIGFLLWYFGGLNVLKRKLR